MSSNLAVLLLLSLLAVLSSSSQYVPIPRHKLGLTLGDLHAPLHIKAFYDLLCPDSKSSHATLRSLLGPLHLLESSGQRVRLTVYSFPLPYHIYAYKIHQGLEHVHQTLGAYSALKYLEYVLQVQDRYQQSKWRGHTIEEFMEYFSEDIAQNIKGVDSKKLYKSLLSGSDEDIRVRENWKYGTGVLGVSGTPIFYGNGVRIDGAEDWDSTQWAKFIQKHTTSN